MGRVKQVRQISSVLNISLQPRAIPLRSAKPAERTASRDVRRRQMIEATIVEIAERGISGFKLSDVAKSAGVAVGMVNLHFTTKAALLDQTLDHLSDEYQACWKAAIGARGLDPARRLYAMMAADFDPAVCTRRRIAVWHAFYGEARARPAYRERCALNEADHHEHLSKLCAALTRRSGYKNISAEQAARMLAALTDGMWLDILLSGGRIDRDGSLETLDHFLMALFPKDFPLRPEA